MLGNPLQEKKGEKPECSALRPRLARLDGPGIMHQMVAGARRRVDSLRSTKEKDR